MYAISLVLQAEATGLTLQKVVSEIPHDPGAFVAYLLVGSMIFLTWYGSRRSVIERYPARRSDDTGTFSVQAESGPAQDGRSAAEDVQDSAAVLRPPSADRPRKSRRSRNRDERIGWIN